MNFDDISYTCQHCKKTFKWRGSAETHIKKCKLNPDAIEPDKQKCQYCGIEATDKSYFKRLHGENCLQNPANVNKMNDSLFFYCEHCEKIIKHKHYFLKNHGDNCSMKPKI